VQALKKHNYTT